MPACCGGDFRSHRKAAGHKAYSRGQPVKARNRPNQHPVLKKFQSLFYEHS